MILIETCPKCGSDLFGSVICTYPPISRKECPSCGWSWESRPTDVIKVPFDESKQGYQPICESQHCDISVDTCLKVDMKG